MVLLDFIYIGGGFVAGGVVTVTVPAVYNFLKKETTSRTANTLIATANTVESSIEKVIDSAAAHIAGLKADIATISSKL